MPKDKSKKKAKKDLIEEEEDVNDYEQIIKPS